MFWLSIRIASMLWRIDGNLEKKNSYYLVYFKEVLPGVLGNMGKRAFISGEQGNKSQTLRGTILGNRGHKNFCFDFWGTGDQNKPIHFRGIKEQVATWEGLFEVSRVRRCSRNGVVEVLSYLSRVVRKPAYCIYENKDADQLRGNREADQRLCFRYTDSTIPLLSKSENSSL